MDFMLKLVTWHLITGFVLYVPVLLTLYMNRDRYMKDRAVVILSLLVTLTAWEYFAVCSICRRIMDTADRAADRETARADVWPTVWPAAWEIDRETAPEPVPSERVPEGDLVSAGILWPAPGPVPDSVPDSFPTPATQGCGSRRTCRIIMLCRAESDMQDLPWEASWAAVVCERRGLFSSDGGFWTRPRAAERRPAR